MEREALRELISQMTLEEKAGMCSGGGFWHTKGVERLGIPRTMVSDGPHGLRKQTEEGDHLGIRESIKAVCFPAGCATAASFNKELITALGEVLGNECQAEGVSVILGPAMNIKRSPLCGRNFEYYSEDPYLATNLAAALIKGVQSKHIGTSPKHFLANNQEHRRMSSSSEVDTRTLREIYLAAFEGAIKKEKPWTVMCAYNKINGIYAAENKTYLTDVLRGEWGFDGYVVSDWGAVNKRVADLEAGLDLEMPPSGVTDQEIVEAVREGTLKEAVLDTACERILNIVYRYEENRDYTAVFDREKDHAFAKEVAKETIVLLKNDAILPLDEKANLAFIGKYAQKPRYQGGGSSHINSFKVVSALDAVADKATISYAKGFEDKDDTVDADLIAEAVEVAKGKDAVVIFAGLPDSFESEGYDRTHMQLPQCQNALIDAVCQVNPNVIVVLHNGSPVEMPWVANVKGILEAYLGGQAIGEAVVDILFGKANPSAKLPETFPIQLEDNPSYLYYTGEGDQVDYREGIFVGYRYYDKKKMQVLFPFGHGLSYTTFAYSNLQLDKSSMLDTDHVAVSVDVTNTGKMAGKEVVQLYVANATEKDTIRPVRELRGFEKVSLCPGETKTVHFTLCKRAFAYWHTTLEDWVADTGCYHVQIGKSSRDIVLAAPIEVVCTSKVPVNYTEDTIIGDLIADEAIKEKLADLMLALEKRFHGKAKRNPTDEGAISKDMGMAMIKYMPLHGARTFTGMTTQEIDDLVVCLNAMKEANG